MIRTMEINQSKVLDKKVILPKTEISKIRIFDILFSSFAIVLFSLPMLIIALLIKLYSPKGAILFKQKRLGLNGKEFEVFKFRTMIPNAEEKLNELLESDEEIKKEYLTYRKLKNDIRIIPKIGSFLRKTSLDELPQFFNVLFGTMSVVGPRPIIKSELEMYGRYSQKFLSVKPGVTGLWQVSSNRNNMSYDDRVALDMEYIDNKSFRQDMKIVFKTIKVMAFREGI